MKNVVCPKCSQPTASCRYVGDLGGVDYSDCYGLTCDGCGHRGYENIYGGSPIADSYDTACPWCHVSHRDHLKFEHKSFDPAVRPDSSDTDGLVAAVREGDADAVAQLLSQGVYPDSNDGYSTVLMIAARQGNSDIARALVTAGADVNCRTWDGWSALMHASRRKSTEVVELLLASGADPSFQDGRNKSARTLADGAAEILQLLDQAERGRKSGGGASAQEPGRQAEEGDRTAPETGRATPGKLYTIGYGGRQPSDLASILTAHRVRAVVDVRLRPDRASMGSYARAKTSDKGIQKLLSASGIEYFPLTELGNLFLEFADWQARYEQLFERAADLLTSRLADVPRPYCLLCAERDPAACHRMTIAGFLGEQGFEIEHL